MFKPGQSGNPNGRPKGTRSIPDLLRRFGEWDAPDDIAADMAVRYGPKAKGLTIDEATWLSVRTLAMQGNSWAVQLVAERTEGKVAQEHKIGNAIEGAFEIRIE